MRIAALAVYQRYIFQTLSTQNIISSSGRTATIELLTPITAGIRTKKKGSAGRTRRTGGASGYHGYAVSRKTVKNSNKSPASKKRSTVGFMSKVIEMLN